MKYEFAVIFKIRKLHIKKKKSLSLASLEKTQRPSWQQWAEAESKLYFMALIWI